jgi:hypothetical protein
MIGWDDAVLLSSQFLTLLRQSSARTGHALAMDSVKRLLLTSSLPVAPSFFALPLAEIALARLSRPHSFPILLHFSVCILNCPPFYN